MYILSNEAIPMPLRRFPAFLLAALLAPIAVAQNVTAGIPANGIEFDVASFKLNLTDGILHGFSIPAGGDGFTSRNRPIRDLIRYAFGRPDNGGSFHISGEPEWVDKDNYDVQAKVAPGDLSAWEKLNLTGQKLALQHFLAVYLKLKYHQDPSSYPYYALVVSKNGAKLKEYTPGETFRTPEGVLTTSTGVCHFISSFEVTGQACAMDHLASLLSNHTDRPILNKTGLAATYSFELHFDGASDPRMNSEHLFGPEALPPQVATDSIRLALRQLGLELVPANGPLDGIVIDHVERPPEN